MGIAREDLVMICCSDLSGQVRGKGVPARDLERHRRFGVGWTPSNVMINALGRIAATPFGALGDLHLVPVDGTEVALDLGDDAPPLRWTLGRIRTLDGEPWACCLRSLLERALAALESRAGLRLVAAFEHEFHKASLPCRTHDAYGLGRLYGLQGFVGDLLGALRANGLGPETFLPEYGPAQFEVTLEPAPALVAADRAVNLREITRAVARHHGTAVSFSPMVTPGFVGNGVHVHMSLADTEGRPVTYDPRAPYGLSRTAGAFAAGILRHARALSAVTAPSPVSYLRLRPHSWSAFFANLGANDREALLRICPYPLAADIDPAPRFNLEYRGGDAASSPYLHLAMLVFAGLAGIVDDLPTPTVTTEDPDGLGALGRAAKGIADLPRSLAEALDALEADATALAWLGPVLAEAYPMHKRAELQMVAERSEDDLVTLYAEVY
ncbi:MAG: glutamine synthetase [Pseudomonadota bacterium]